MQKTTFYRIDDSLTLVRVALVEDASTAVTATKPPTDHIFACDVSGSMDWTLPKMAEQINSEIARLVGPDDTFSLIAFSGRRQCEVILRAEKIAGISDLASIKAKVTQYLRSVGMTGFVDPLRSIADITASLRKAGRETISVLFLTDGCDNQWNRDEILNEVASIQGVSSWTFLQYGGYADGQFLAQMASKVGGNVIFAADFTTYKPTFEAQFGKVVQSKSVEVKFAHEVVEDLAFGVRGKDLISKVVPSDRKVTVPLDMGEIYYLTTASVSGPKLSFAPSTGIDPKPLYAAIATFAQRMKSKIVTPMLRAAGDKALCEKYARAFGPVLLGEFANVATRAANGEGRYVAGFDSKAMPDPNAFTILDLIRALADDDDNRLLLDDPRYVYNVMTRKKVDANDVLAPDEQAKVDALNAEIAATKSIKKKQSVQAQIDAIYAAKSAKTLHFEADVRTDGYGLDSITLNATRPNVSIMFNKQGTVDISSAVAAEKQRLLDEAAQNGKPAPDMSYLDALPTKVRTHIIRNHALVAYGVTNVPALPCRVTKKTWNRLASRGVVSGAYTDGDVCFDLKSMPVINENMITDVSAQSLFEMEYEALTRKASRKVYDFVYDSLYPKKDTETVNRYGEEATRFLNSIGISSNGFSPLQRSADPTDEIQGVEVAVKFEGLSALPAVSAVYERMKKIEDEAIAGPGKAVTKAKKGAEYTTSMLLMKDALEAIRDKVGKTKFTTLMDVLTDKPSKKSDTKTEEEKLAKKGKSAAIPAKEEPKVSYEERLEKASSAIDLAALKVYLEKHSDSEDVRVKELSMNIAQIKFAIAVGQVWPIEFGGDISKGTLTIKDQNGNEVTGELKVTPYAVKI